MTTKEFEASAGSEESLVGIILVNYNSGYDLVDCLGSLVKQNGKAWRILVVDNFSPEGIAPLLDWFATYKAFHSNKTHEPYSGPALHIVDEGCMINEWGVSGDIFLVQSSYNRGFAGANNLALSKIFACPHFSHAWLLNPDTVVLPETGLELLKAFSQEDNVGLAGSTLVYYHGEQRVQGVGVNYNIFTTVGAQIFNGFNLSQLPSEASRVDDITYLIGASMMVSREFYQEIGPMCEDYFLYFEEIDWAVRARGRFTMRWAPLSIVYHKEGGAIGTSTVSDPSALSVFFMSRSMLMFYKKHFPLLIPVALLRLGFNLLRFTLRGRWKLCRSILSAIFDFVRISWKGSSLS